MDDGIYRDFYWAADQAEVWWAIIWPALQTDIAIKIYVALLGLSIFGASLYRASMSKREIVALLSKIKHKPFLGRPPTKLESVLIRVRQITMRTVKSAQAFGENFTALAYYGVLIPSFVFVVFILNYSWFDPDGAAFVITQSGAAVHEISFNQAVAFVYDQITHSLFFDVPEVFSINTTPLANNSDNTAFSTLVVLFRLSVVGFAYFLYRSVKASAPILFELYRQDRADIAALMAKRKT